MTDIIGSPDCYRLTDFTPPNDFRQFFGLAGSVALKILTKKCQTGAIPPECVQIHLIAKGIKTNCYRNQAYS
jgi:hypothetical protein